MKKCPYCARPLRMGGVRCRACRRYVLGWPHLLLLIAVCLVVVAGFVELFSKI
ncbi:MAG TPA: hypothetical protein VM934_06515 [Pyrinomonadaceae bacterium]|nr:hypothetical protein [Pyrinomonadaceae bacterium]